MNLWRKTTWLLALVLAPISLHADTRQQAVAACDAYRQAQHQTCFVSRGTCPRGFEPLADFSDESGTRFTACRDSRHKLPRRTARGLPEDELLQEYNRLTERLQAQRLGDAKTLPQTSVERLRDAFRNLPLEHLKLISTGALKQGCFTDCQTIYCAANGAVARWTDKASPVIELELLHQLAHVQSCLREGGRERFVKRWFHHLPDDVLQKLLAEEPLDASRLHFAMYLESRADSLAQTICRRLTDCKQGW